MTMHIFSHIFKRISLSVILGTAFGFLFTGYMVAAFSEPPLGPPGSNTKPPLDQSNVAQIKDGALEVNEQDIAATGLRVFKGYAQIDVRFLGPPPLDCNSGEERGRMVLDYFSNVLYFCAQGAVFPFWIGR